MTVRQYNTNSPSQTHTAPSVALYPHHTTVAAGLMCHNQFTESDLWVNGRCGGSHTIVVRAFSQIQEFATKNIFPMAGSH